VCRAKYYTIPPAIYSCAKTVKFQKKKYYTAFAKKKRKNNRPKTLNINTQNNYDRNSASFL
jgi:hypothetical protein